MSRAEIKAKFTRGKQDEQAFLAWFGQHWESLVSAALFFKLGKEAEIGIALQHREGAKAFLGAEVPSRLWSSVPENAMFAFAGRQKVSELVDSIGKLLPMEGRRAIRVTLEQTLAPVIGRDKLPLVIDSLGPDFGLWLVPPQRDGVLPVPVFALEVQAGPRQAQIGRAHV